MSRVDAHWFFFFSKKNGHWTGLFFVFPFAFTSVREGYRLGSIYPWNPRTLPAGVPGFDDLEQGKADGILDVAQELGLESWITQMCTDDQMWEKLGDLLGPRDRNIDLTGKPLNYQRALGVLGSGARQHNFDIDVQKLQASLDAFVKKVQSAFNKSAREKMTESARLKHPKNQGSPPESALDESGEYQCAKGVTGCYRVYTRGDAEGEQWFSCCYC